MTFPRWATTVTPFSKALAVIIFFTFPILGFLLGIKYQSSFNTPKRKIIDLPISTVEIEPTGVESFCAKSGERSVSNFDMTTGKINPNIENKDCCSGLKKIAGKQPIINNNQNICGQITGKSYEICSPCGNDICDSQYEDQCNCPEDCK